MTADLCKALYEASLDSVQVTLYSDKAAVHNALVGVDGFGDTVAGIKNAVESGLIVSINTPLCSVNRDYADTHRAIAPLRRAEDAVELDTGALTFEESLQTTELYSVAGALPKGVSLIRRRPFRSPHHTVSPAGLSGGGAIPRPGEISLAHNGVLFLDELPEFSRVAMEVLRQPIEDGKITISRANASLTYPCSAMVVCAMNPCPCGFHGHPKRECTCPEGAAKRYLARISGPLLDRIDIHIEVPPVDFDKLSSRVPSECSADIKKRVNAARRIQQERLKGTGVSCNAKMDAALTKRFCSPTPEAVGLLEEVFEKLDFSARAYDKVLRVSRTIADLDGCESIEASHIAQAVQYRSLDRKLWRK